MNQYHKNKLALQSKLQERLAVIRKVQIASNIVWLASTIVFIISILKGT